MKRADFDAVVREFEPLIRQEGFTGSRGTYRLPDGVRFKFLLDKYGWDPMLGWGFLLDVEDTTKADELGNVPVAHHLQVRPYTLAKAVGKKTLMKLYDDNPTLKSQIQSGWFVFDHADRLRDVLNTVLEPALAHIRAWSESK